jgi:hypothetical protein
VSCLDPARETPAEKAYIRVVDAVPQHVHMQPAFFVMC